MRTFLAALQSYLSMNNSCWNFANEPEFVTGRQSLFQAPTANFNEFVRKDEEIFAKLFFDGKALKLYTPSTKTLLLSKIYLILDSPEGKDLQNIEDLIDAKVVGHKELEDAVADFDSNIRFKGRPRSAESCTRTCPHASVIPFEKI